LIFSVGEMTRLCLGERRTKDDSHSHTSTDTTAAEAAPQHTFHPILNPPHPTPITHYFALLSYPSIHSHSLHHLSILQRIQSNNSTTHDSTANNPSDLTLHTLLIPLPHQFPLPYFIPFNSEEGACTGPLSAVTG